MRLTKIRLAGFKSFVDPITLHLPSNLMGIVGPNGCGKSNIIDAVRWVMGESSARTLRGESMTDVIFNGSVTRKPVGQASIELVFDNSAGRLGGPWAGYNEISIKRLVSREGQSSYFLNNLRCRRRDITDIFLGTGLGPRSYAIVEQGTISRVIESRPEELRVFLEEAAGISRYKDRRRETETRIRHTQENLDRLNDLREELARQLQHLQRQARAAERYQDYRAEERRLTAELLALRWKDLDEDVMTRERLIREQQTALEAVVAEQRAIEAQLEAGRSRQEALNEQLTQARERCYEVEMEITRLEQDLHHRRDLRRRQVEERRQTERDLERVGRDIRLDEDRLRELEGAIAHDQPLLEEAEAVEAEMAECWRTAEAAMQDWRSAWEAFGRRQAEARREADLQRAHVEHLERQLLRHEQQMARLTLEQDNLNEQGWRQDLEDLHCREQEAAAAIEQEQRRLSQIEEAITGLREAVQGLTAVLNKIQENIQAGRGRLASLEALQETALGRHEDGAGEWLRERRLAEAPRLAERIEVEPGWEQAVETVLSHHLQAVGVADLNISAAELAGLEQANLTLFDTAMGAAKEKATLSEDGLAAKIYSSWPVGDLLGGVRIAADLHDALTRRGELRANESLITPDGVWVGRCWLRVIREPNENQVLVREREIRALKGSLQQDAKALDRQSGALEQMRIELGDLERQRAVIQQTVNEGHREHARLQGQIDTLHVRLEQTLARHGAISEELQELHRHAQQDREALQETRQRLAEVLCITEQMEGERDILLERRQGLHSEVEEYRARVQSARQETQQQALVLASRRPAQASTRQALERLEAQQAQLAARREQLQRDTAAEDGPLEAIQTQLEALLKDRIATEERLGEARRAAEEQDMGRRALEQARSAAERRAQEWRQTLEAQRLGWSEARGRRQTLLDRLQELNVDLNAVLAQLPAGAEASRWEVQLEQLGHRIQRLGAVNLAAIEEFAQLSERQHYLDSQNHDLVEALSTLENAMRKIDRETRSRFRETFDQVNRQLQALFPRLFGGGRAYLQLTSEELLEAGVTIMAQPPGKRISNIHLLSGGEKALTAVAFVFAIFQLNPAPFCMLDEVDAPLDDANVGRFGKLVQELSEQVQFIFITHNKGTMEIALHLAGVTMQEPGVSRLVAVDVDEAMRLAAV